MRPRPPPTATELQVRVLQQIARLRVVSAPQAHRLVDHFASHTLDNTYRRLKTLTRNGLLRAQLVRPDRGRFSPTFYALTSPALRILKRERDRYLLARPPQHILEYLLFRNDVYAAARTAGWIVASPVLTPPEHHGRALEAFRAWALDAKRRELLELQSAGRPPADVARAAQDLERLPRFLPTALTFDFLMRRNRVERSTDVILLVLDDPRRAVTVQAADLPRVDPERRVPLPAGRHLTVPGLRLMLRDAASRYDVAGRTVYRASARLRAWRRVLADHFGEAAVAAQSTDALDDVRRLVARMAADVGSASAPDRTAVLALETRRRELAAWPPIHFPDLWAQRVNEPSDVNPHRHWKEHLS
jgi:hypothetical protein